MEIGFKAGEGSIEHFPARYDHDIETVSDLTTPEDFPRQPFGAIPIDGAANLARGGHAEARAPEAIGQYEDGHEAAVDAGALVVEALELRPPADPLGRGQFSVRRPPSSVYGPWRDGA